MKNWRSISGPAKTRSANDCAWTTATAVGGDRGHGQDHQVPMDRRAAHGLSLPSVYTTRQATYDAAGRIQGRPFEPGSAVARSGPQPRCEPADLRYPLLRGFL